MNRIEIHIGENANREKERDKKERKKVRMTAKNFSSKEMCLCS